MVRYRSIVCLLAMSGMLCGVGCSATPEAAETPETPKTPKAPVALALFDGETLDGWHKVGGGATYRVEDGCIVGEVGPGPNTFLRTDATYDDFELVLDVRLDIPGNSGIQFRSHQKEENGRVYGYQCEIDPTDRAWSGGIYDEGRRGWLASLEDKPEAQAAFKLDDWNTYRIVAIGDHLQTWVNGVPCADMTDEADREGFIALQVHSGKAGRIRWRNIMLTPHDHVHDGDADHEHHDDGDHEHGHGDGDGG